MEIPRNFQKGGGAYTHQVKISSKQVAVGKKNG